MFNQWEEAAQGGEYSEANFCNAKSLNMPALKTVWEAKRQLKDILISSGLPEECLLPEVRRSLFNTLFSLQKIVTF